jgi:DNA polymerase III subunit epsilon
MSSIVSIKKYFETTKFMRQIILDTETTGREISEGHRIIEIGCLEMVDRRLTQRHFHCYLNPQRESDAAALAVHGLTSEFLKNKPLFTSIADEFIAFIKEAELIIHNAPFDLTFLDHELNLTQKNYAKLTYYCQILDTLPLARQLHPGQRNNLDALCKRYGVDNSRRERHGALLDAELLAGVYLAMTGGQVSLFDTGQTTPLSYATEDRKNIETKQLPVILATEEECNAHTQCLANISKISGTCVWDHLDARIC